MSTILQCNTRKVLRWPILNSVLLNAVPCILIPTLVYRIILLIIWFLFLKKSSLQNLIPSILENLTHQKITLKLPDLYQAKIKPKTSSLILTVKASNFEYCLFSRNNFRADLSILFQQGRHSLLCNQRAGLCNKRSLGVEFQVNYKNQA